MNIAKFWGRGSRSNTEVRFIAPCRPGRIWPNPRLEAPFVRCFLGGTEVKHEMSGPRRYRSSLAASASCPHASCVDLRQTARFEAPFSEIGCPPPYGWEGIAPQRTPRQHVLAIDSMRIRHFDVDTCDNIRHGIYMERLRCVLVIWPSRGISKLDMTLAKLGPRPSKSGRSRPDSARLSHCGPDASQVWPGFGPISVKLLPSIGQIISAELGPQSTGFRHVLPRFLQTWGAFDPIGPALGLILPGIGRHLANSAELCQRWANT